MNALPQLQLALGDPITVLFTILRVTAVYVALLFFLRLFGGRQFGQLSAVDLVTLLLLSNVVQNAMIGPDDSTLGGVLGAAALLLLYRLTTHIPGIQGRLETHPVVLVYQGRVEDTLLRREGISLNELGEAVRAHGVADLSHVETAVLEMNGTISVIPKSEATPRKLLKVGSRRRKSQKRP